MEILFHCLQHKPHLLSFLIINWQYQKLAQDIHQFAAKNRDLGHLKKTGFIVKPYSLKLNLD